MSESTKKIKTVTYMKYNVLAVKRLAKKFEVSEYYIRQSIKGAVTSDTCEMIKKEYKSLCEKIECALKD